MRNYSFSGPFAEHIKNHVQLKQAVGYKYVLSPTLFEPESPEVCGFAGPAGSVGATGRKSSTG